MSGRRSSSYSSTIGASTAFTRLLETVAELRRTRAELARVAVAEERERFSRDLHDLLGHTLSVMVVKAQAVRRLAATDPDAAAEHAADIERVGRTALLDVRQAVDAMRAPSLSEELVGARDALEAAGIRATIEAGATDVARGRRRRAGLGAARRESPTCFVTPGRAAAPSRSPGTATTPSSWSSTTAWVGRRRPPKAPRHAPAGSTVSGTACARPAARWTPPPPARASDSSPTCPGRVGVRP